MKNRYFHYSHRRMEKPRKMEFHLHDQYEIYFFISGDVHYLIEKKVYPLEYGDLLIMNNRELHKATFRSDAPYENIVIHFDPAVAAALAAVSPYPLLDCFVRRPLGEHNKIAFNHQQLDEATTLFHRIEQLAKNEEDGSELLLTAYMTELLVLINRVHRQSLSPTASCQPELDHKLAPVLDYIDHHLDQDLSLETLERLFYVNRYYLSRLFKRTTGSTIHEYIVLKRIAEAKRLLKEDYNVTDACQLSGFNDYSNFIRMFKRYVGISPGQYRKRD
ncbi:AraC family transcriptional regulator [Paenibacillus filicis]|uniref:AraC family transcriptional regulator n=1 Tax=Paenibacillus gyeongsangnamensis TaxID=3388067 RepID=A0ABT4Q7D7_9BACL|nr:AraC family transcriptional regulator [Paenibacillus filicis]MCZ8512784.1 AraC family transcriptional regulator [Paenibacillus filicis]